MSSLRPARGRPALRTGLSALAVSALLAAGGVFAIAPSAAAAPAAGDVSGQVFRDFNSNGAFDTAGGDGVAVDRGLAGVTATAYDAADKKVGTATTGEGGGYDIQVSGATSSDLRVEFTGLPAGYESSYHGDDSSTSVQFVKAGAQNVDYAVNAPEDYSQGGAAPIVTPIDYSGALSYYEDNADLDAKSPSLVANPWTVQTNDNNEYADRTTLATNSQTGSLWGTAFQKSTGDVFAAASLRRMSALGPQGLGGIYRLKDAVKADGTINPATSVEDWLIVQGLPVAGGGTVDLGASQIDLDDSVRGLAEPNKPTLDTKAYDAIGKVGIGSIVVSTDQKTLYFLDLFDGNVYGVDIANPVQATKVDLGLGAGERPWALQVHRGQLYVGFVDSGESQAERTSPAGLKFHVRAAPESDLGKLANAGSEVLAGDLGYTKGAPWQTCDANNAALYCSWHPWASAPEYDVDKYAFQGWGADWAQPMLTGLEFSADGYLVVGLDDRFSLQAGTNNYGPLAVDAANHQTVSTGDTLIASPKSDGSFELESDGTAGSYTTAEASGMNVAQGPGGKEFFSDYNEFGDKTHREITNGGLASLAGVDQVATSSFDPAKAQRTNGVGWLNTHNGVLDKGYQLTNDGQEGTFQKGGGLGDIQVLVNEAPVEIGNRVWFDKNSDGIQGADEAPVPGVTVALADKDGKPVKDAAGDDVAPVKTDADGEYYFSDLVPNSDYKVTFDSSTVSDTAFSDLGTTKDAVTWTKQGTETGEADTVDSDADAQGVALVSVGGPGQNDHTIDAGLAPAPELCSLGDFVWNDADHDGVQDAGEAGVPGVTVTLLNPDGTPADGVDPVTTDSDGKYSFTDLPCGTYKVRFSGIPAGSQFTTPNAGDDAADSDATPSTDDPTTGTTGDVVLGGSEREDNPTVDAGIFTPPASTYAVGDYVWIDANHDGIQDQGETPVVGATVTLLNADGTDVAGVDPVKTDSQGLYLFDLVPAGDYKVKFELPTGLPAGTVFTTKNGADSTSANDSNPDAASGVTDEFTLAEDAADVRATTDDDTAKADFINPTIDAGIYAPAPELCSIGDFVWNDADHDGVQGDGESGVPGVTVELLNSAGDVVGTQTTDDKGEYSFTDVPCGTYKVRFSGIPEGSEFTTPNAGDDAADSDVKVSDDPKVGTTEDVVLGGDEAKDNPTVDAGIVLPVAPEGKCSLGDFAFSDVNGNGIQDDGEPGVEGVTVELLNSDGDVIATMVTDAAGKYEFSDLKCGTYKVRFTAPEGAGKITKPNAGDDDAKDSDPTPDGDNPRTGTTGEVVLGGDDSDDPTVDVGVIPAPAPEICSVGDTVWLDADKDGVQDAGEHGVAGVTVQLLKGDEVIATQKTDANGTYEFKDLDCGTYQVKFSGIPAGASFTEPNAGDDDAKDSDAVPTQGDAKVGLTGPVLLGVEGSRHDDPRVDAGIVLPDPLCSIGSLAFDDLDADGVQDKGEAGVAGVTVELLDSHGKVVKTVVTDSHGKYAFTDVPCGTYQVRFTAPKGDVLSPDNRGDNPGADSDPVAEKGHPGTGTTHQITVTPENPNDLDVNAGIVHPKQELCSVGDIVWLDADKDGIQDKGEALVQGVTVELLDAKGDVVAHAVTDENGSYLFSGIDCGTYQVRFGHTPKGTSFTAPGAGKDRSIDSNADAKGLTAKFTVGGENAASDLTIDAGLVGPADAVPAGGKPLVRTGADGVMPLAIGAAALILLGGVALLVFGRRRNA